jgi:geranylgeranyl transferase type-2 subunit beta
VRDKHIKYLEQLDKTKDADAIGFYTNEHLKLPGGYWCVGALSLLKKLYWERKDEIMMFVKACQCKETGGFGGNLNHDPHITTSLYALLIAAMFDSLDEIDTDKLADFMASLQNPDGSFNGDYAGEIDTRFSYCGISALSLLDKLDKINVEKARDFILSCQNLDGAFGGMPGAESHAAYVFCCVGSLKMMGYEALLDKDKLGLWLSRR